jgi:hypothetical protein
VLFSPEYLLPERHLRLAHPGLRDDNHNHAAAVHLRTGSKLLSQSRGRVHLLRDPILLSELNSAAGPGLLRCTML